jgi:hypothetical protein
MLVQHGFTGNSDWKAFEGMETSPLNHVDNRDFKTLYGNITHYTDSWHSTYGAETLRAVYVDSNTTDSISSLVQQINFALPSYHSFEDIQDARKKGKEFYRGNTHQPKSRYQSVSTSTKSTLKYDGRGSFSLSDSLFLLQYSWLLQYG